MRVGSRVESKMSEEKKIEALQAKIEQLLKEKVDLEIELETLKTELSTWKNKYQVLKENLSRMGKSPETLSQTEPKPKTKAVVDTEQPGQKLSEKYGIDPGEAAVLAIEYDLIKRGQMRTGVYPSDESET